MLSYRIKEENVIWLGLITSLLIHGLLFVCSRLTIIQRAEFGVQPSVMMVEVSIKEIKSPETSSTSATTDVEEVKRKIPTQGVRAVHSKSSVKVKANPDYYQNPAPEYPELAKQMQQEGLVMLSVEVDRTGDPLKVEIIQSSGYRLLDQAAIKAVSHWKFQPGSVGGIPVESTVTVPIRFQLQK